MQQIIESRTNIDNEEIDIIKSIKTLMSIKEMCMSTRIKTEFNEDD